MLNENVKAWLDAPDDYPAGLALLRETGYAGFTLTILSMGEDAYNRTRLETELSQWLTAQQDVLRSTPAAPFQTEFNSEAIIPKFQTSTPEIPKIPTSSPVDSLQKQIYALMDERSEAKAWLRAKIDLGNSDEACAHRLPKAIRIKQITRLIDELYSQIHFYQQHGYLLPGKDDPAVVVDDTTALLNARSYVSRYKNKLKNKKLTPEQRQSAEKLLNQYSDEKNRLETKRSKSNDPDSTRQQTADRERHPAPFP